MKRLALLVFALSIFSCSDRKMYPTDGALYCGKIYGTEIELALLHNELDMYLDDGKNTAFYRFGIHPLRFHVDSKSWMGQLFFKGSDNIRDDNMLWIFENDKEYGGITITSIEDRMWIGEFELDKPTGEEADEIFRHLFVTSSRDLFYSSANDWPKKFK